jgi:putative Ca2+/H+ antiporter (TMEM165/GDT1 family)
LLSLGVVFLAELGDRSQLITLTYALRYRWWVVLTGVAIAAFMVHGLSVTIGHFLGATLPARPIAFASAIAFLVFAVWAWREGGAGDETVTTSKEPRFALLTVMSSWALAEMSDKTSLATLTLASDHDWTAVWIGTTVGIVLADGLAIGVGILLHRRLPQPAVPDFRPMDAVRQRAGFAVGGRRGNRGGGAGRRDGDGCANSATAPKRSFNRREVRGHRLRCPRHPSPQPAVRRSRPRGMSVGD